MAALKIRSTEVYRYTLPLRTPLRLRGEQVGQREGFLLKLVSDTGAVGWGDAAPLPGFSAESRDAAGEVLLRCARRLAGFEVPREYSYFEGAEIARTDDMATVGFAVESAWFAMLADAAQQPLFQYLNPAAHHRIRVNALLSGGEEFVLTQAEAVRTAGYAAAKLKVGGEDVAAAAEFVRKVREILPEPFILRLDANRAWSMAEATHFARLVADMNLDYIEEPLQDPFELPVFLERTGMPYALDETLHEFHHEIRASFDRETVKTEAFALHVRRLLGVFRAAHAVVWKPSLIYLPNMGDDILHGRFALPINRLVLSAAFESGVGIGQLAHYAAAYSRPGEPAGLDTYTWLAEDLLLEPLPLPAGEIDVMAIGGLARGINPDRVDLMESFEK